MNPPFGTKNNEGIDMKLLHCCVNALKKPGGVVFSLHKAATQKYIKKYVETNMVNCEVSFLSKIQFDLPSTYKFHKKSKSIIYLMFNYHLLFTNIENTVVEVVLVKIACK